MRKILFPLFFLALSPALFSQNWFETFQAADLMLSGAGFNQTGGPLPFNHPSGIASDGVRFLVCDRFNNRILIWNNLPLNWDTPPDLVLGQVGFETNLQGNSKAGLNFPGNVSLAPNGKIAVADTENDRILLWNQLPATNGQPADISLHLPDFTPPGASLPYSWPWGVWTDGARLIASATQGKALLFWNNWPQSDNQAPDFTITHPSFGTLRNISTDGESFLAVGEHNSAIPDLTNTAITYFWNSFPTATNQPYDWYLPEWVKGVKTADGKFIAGGIVDVKIWNALPQSAAAPADLLLSNNWYNNGDGNDIVVAGGRLFVNNYNGNNVQVYDEIPDLPGQQPDWALGSPAVDYNTLNDLHYMQNPVLCSDGQHLIATSDFDRTLWIWNTVEPLAGQAPDVAINLKTSNLFVRGNAVFNQKLILAGQKNVAIWNGVPAGLAGPDKIFTNHIGTAQFDYLNAVAYDSAFFYLGERSGKIWLWDHLPDNASDNPDLQIDLPYEPLSSLHSDGEYLTATIQNGQPYIFIFKVAELQNGNLTPWKIITRDPPMPGQPPSLPLNLCAGAIAFDGSLAIANTNNHNVLLWENIENAGDPASAIVLGQPQMANTQPGLGDQYLTLPQSLCAVGQHLWVGEVKFSSRIVRYSYEASSGAFSPAQPPVAVWPNPVCDRFYIDAPEPLRAVRVFDAQGRCMGNFSSQSISVDGWPSGLYFLQINTENEVFTASVFKN